MNREFLICKPLTNADFAVGSRVTEAELKTHFEQNGMEMTGATAALAWQNQIRHLLEHGLISQPAELNEHLASAK